MSTFGRGQSIYSNSNGVPHECSFGDVDTMFNTMSARYSGLMRNVYCMELSGMQGTNYSIPGRRCDNQHADYPKFKSLLCFITYYCLCKLILFIYEKNLVVYGFYIKLYVQNSEIFILIKNV